MFKMKIKEEHAMFVSNMRAANIDVNELEQ